MAHELDALSEVSQFTDAELVCRLERLVTADRALSAKLLVHLGEVDERGLYREHGYSSMFDYCRTALGMSEAEAYLRIYAAKVGRRFPLVLERLGAGAVHLSAIKLLSPHLTADNHVQLLDRAQGKTKRQIEALVAELAPKPDVPARMRKLPDAPSRAAELSQAEASTAASPATSLPLSASAESSTGGLALVSPVAPAAPAPFALQSPRARASCTALSPGRFKLELTLGQDSHDTIEQLRELLRHQNPSGDVICIVERALRELLVRTMKQRFGHTNAPERRAHHKQNAHSKPDVSVKADASASKSRYIPRKVLREVYARDAGQCTFVSVAGRRCAARSFIEVHHHDTTFARGGEATAGNLRLTCRAHNALFAERDYGRAFMQDKLRAAGVEKRSARNVTHFDPSARTRATSHLAGG